MYLVHAPYEGERLGSMPVKRRYSSYRRRPFNQNIPRIIDSQTAGVFMPQGYVRGTVPQAMHYSHSRVRPPPPQEPGWNGWYHNLKSQSHGEPLFGGEHTVPSWYERSQWYPPQVNQFEECRHALQYDAPYNNSFLPNSYSHTCHEEGYCTESAAAEIYTPQEEFTYSNEP